MHPARRLALHPKSARGLSDARALARAADNHSASPSAAHFSQEDAPDVLISLIQLIVQEKA